MAPELRPFADEHLEEAGRLLAARHRAHRAAEPLLPARYEEPAAAAGEVEALWRADGASGAVAFRDGRMTAFVVGMRRDDARWGPNVWVENAGQAATEPEDLRDAYALAAERWVGEGRVRQYVMVPASGALVDAWFRLGFGLQHAYGIREVPDEPWPESVRLARLEDADGLVELSPLLLEHQARSPVFGLVEALETPEELRAQIIEDLANPAIGDLVVERDGTLVGAFQVAPVELSGMHAALARPDGAALLSWAASRPEVRGSGAGVALTAAAFAWARGRGHATMVTDWRVTNLLSSRFWPRRGFRDTFLRLYRAIP